MSLIFFYVFAAITVFSGLMVISARNPVHAVLFLILAFFNAAGVMLLLGAEFLAMMLVIVYVGAVAVLFLFVVMMLDVDFATLRGGFARYAPVGALVGGVLLIEMIVLASRWPSLQSDSAAYPVSPHPGSENTLAFAMVLYDEYLLIFQTMGLILLTAMIGAIVLTLRQRSGGRKQNISRQIHRPRSASIELARVDSGRGVDHS